MTGRAAENDEILAVLEDGLSVQLGGRQRIVRMCRKPYPYRSSCPLEALDIELDDGRRITMLFKDHSPQTMPGKSQPLRLMPLYDPAREICVYTNLLAHLKLKTADCYAVEIDLPLNRYWLFLEKVAGRELYQFCDLSVWEEAARWLARFHRLASDGSKSLCTLRLLDWDRNRYRQCHERASDRLLVRAGGDEEQKRRFSWIMAVYADVVEHLLNRPKSVIHGEFYASNVLIRDEASGVCVCPIDWETAGWGPALIDLAALVAGRWSDEQRAAMARAYWRSMDDLQRNSWGSIEDFQNTLTACRLHLCVQMLGWPMEWEPPAEHRQDWIHESEQLAAQLVCRLE